MTDQTEKTSLSAAYAVETAEDARKLYADWAEGYEAEMRENGYAAPARCAEALARVMTDTSAPVLDLGCGTGLSGAALIEAGFSVVDGTDFSSEMLEVARRKGIYRNLMQGDLENPLQAEKGDYSAISAIGVFSPGHAPAELIDQAVALLPRGGCMVFTLNDHALADGSYTGRVRELVDTGWAMLRVKEKGPHMPGAGIEAEVYVLQKA
ncbi:class I SAM-dependent DNA methyltransferase [Rhodovulum sp. DZ06]|uniref:class I SAM-dependent DNA methyltransferase n=1 Tax=Rhodovulum sp. DZ06 TaxID=3425126 RepID=UPI003D325307